MTDISLENLESDSTVSQDNRAMKRKAAAARDAMKDLARETGRYASHRVTDAKETATQWIGTAKEKAGDYAECTVDYVQRNPYKAIAMAAGAGFLLGLILKRR